MEIFLKHFTEQFENINPSDITPEKKFRDIEGWDSFIALSIMAMVDQVYNVKLKPEEILKSQTIKELYDIVMMKKNGK